MIIKFLAEGAATTPGSTVEIFVACIAAIPGLIGLWIAVQQARTKRRDKQEQNASAFGTKMAETAFKNMEVQVKRLTEEQDRWDEDRAQWDADKVEMLQKITNLTDQLRITNQYLQLLLSTLDAHSIPRPNPPSGWGRP